MMSRYWCLLLLLLNLTAGRDCAARSPFHNRLTDVGYQASPPLMAAVRHGGDAAVPACRLWQPLPGEAARPHNLRFDSSPDPSRVATGLLIGGGACLLVAAALIAGGIYVEEHAKGDDYLGVLMYAGGAVVGVAGLSLSITGVIIKIVDHARGNRAYYPE